MRRILMGIFDVLFSAFGPQNWWPAESELEVIVGAILTQNTNWSNVEKAIAALKNSGLLSLPALFEADNKTICTAIRPAGYYNQKTKKLKAFADHIIHNWSGDLDAFLSRPLPELRRELLSLYGIGPETADSIILYAAEKPIFVVDRYTYRLMTRHGLYSGHYDYERLQSLFMNALKPDVPLFQEYHALVVKLGKSFCRKEAICQDCPVGQRDI
ncbi:MAG: endonuclease III domain-containing protein [Deltaproteobacteria bacterium]|nr:endonuclease III domain-containing protein [Deltaproteobacteria bacterium]MBW2068156.1 endonuclease III domain-containing protein [Deltaproteobacteria bacterium]